MVYKKKFNKKIDDVKSETYYIRITRPVTRLQKRFASLVANTLSKLPEDIRKKVMDKVSFELNTKGGEVSIIGYPSRKEPAIVLNCASLTKKSDSYIMSSVASLIAMFIVWNLPEYDSKSGEEGRRKATALFKKWGFRKLKDR